MSGKDAASLLVVYVFGDATEVTAGGSRRRQATDAGQSGPLAARELEVLQYLAMGWENASIAAELGLSPHTVWNHWTDLQRKLDLGPKLSGGRDRRLCDLGS